MNTQASSNIISKNSYITSDKESQLTLELLQAIDQKGDINQRDLARGMGVALGLANSYLKRCVKKGWIKITTAPANRYLYYLTPTGFAEKARLTADFFSTSLALFRQSGDAYTAIFDQCIQQGRERVILAGLSDLTEIALMRSMQSAVKVGAVYQPQVIKTEFFGVPVVEKLPQLKEFDCVVLTSMEQTNELIASLEVIFEQDKVQDKIMVPSMLINMRYRNEDYVPQ